VTQSRKASRKAASREKEAGRSWKRRAIFVSAFDPDDGRHPGSPESVRSSRRGRWRLSLGRYAAVGLSKAHAHASMTTGARDASSWGSIATARPHGRLWRFLGLGALGRCARLLSQERGHILGSPPQGKGSRMRASLAARATGNGDARGERVLASAGPHVRGSKSSEGVSTFRIELQKSFDEAAAQRSCSCVSETSARAVNGG